MSTTAVRLPRAIRLLTQYGAAALKPTTENGRYRGPLIPRRIAATFRKRCIIEGTYGQFVPNQGGWDPAWDKERKIFMLDPYKGHKFERNRAERAKKIDVAMTAMPDKIKKYEQEVQDRKPNKRDFAYRFKKALEKSKKYN
eukprot:gene4331-4752_t